VVVAFTTTVADPFSASELVSSLMLGSMVNELAFFVLHVSVTTAPATTDVELAVKLIVGAPAPLFWIGVCEPEPCPPQPTSTINANVNTEHETDRSA
jgi:hypothetical protein